MVHALGECSRFASRKMFNEPLPPSCPPSYSSNGALGQVWRLVKNNPPDENDFLSHAALGKHDYTNDPCGFASCSFWQKEEQAREKQKLPKLRDRKLAELNIPAGSGHWVIKKNGHVDFWRYQGVNILSQVVSVK